LVERALESPRAVPRTTGPPHPLGRRFILLDWSPFRVSHFLLAVRRARRTDSPRSVLPSTTSPGRAPCATGFHARRGSALRLTGPASQRFPSKSRLVALFHATAVRGSVLPSECSPRRNRAPLSGPHAPLQLSTHDPSARIGPSHLRFPGRPRARRACLVPPRTTGPLSLAHAEARARSRSPWVLHHGPTHHCGLRLLRSLAPPTSPFAPAAGLPTTEGRSSPGFLPL
jgi:hypothetical protein